MRLAGFIVWESKLGENSGRAETAKSRGEIRGKEAVKLKRRQRNTFRKKIVGILGCLVVFCTTYALILPAITLEGDTVSWHYEDNTVTVDVTLPEDTDVPSDARLIVRPITDEEDSYRELVWQAGETAARETTGVALYDISFYTQSEEYLPVSDAAVVSIQFKEPLPASQAEYIEVLHYEDAEELPEALETVDVVRGENEEVESVTFQTDGFSVYAVVTLSDEESGIAAQADTNSFTLTYNGYTVTFSLIDTIGNAISLPDLPEGKDTWDITAAAATRYIFGEKDSETLDKDVVVDKIAPEIEGYTYTGALYTNVSVYSVATGGYTDAGGVTGEVNSVFRLYGTEPLQSGQYYTRNENVTVSLIYSKELKLDGQTWAIVNSKDGTTGVAMMAEDSSSSENRRAGAAVTLTENDAVMYVADDVTWWTFEEQSNGIYYISTEVGGEKKYLSVSGSAVTLGDTPEEITVTEGEGTYAGHVRLTNTNGYAVNLYSGSAARGFGGYPSDGSVNEWQTLCKPISELGFDLIYALNTPGMSGKGIGWQTQPSLNGQQNSTTQKIEEDTGALYPQPDGYTEEAGVAGIANLYRFNINNTDLAGGSGGVWSEPAYTEGRMKDAYYGEERFDGWTCTVGGVTYLLEPGAAVSKNADGSMRVAASKIIATDEKKQETVQTITEETLTLFAGTVLTGRWTEVSNAVTFYVNYKGTILDVEGDVQGRRNDTFTKAVAIGHVFYGKQKVGDDQIFGADANALISGAFAPQFTERFDEDNPNTQIVVEYLRECTVPSETGTDYETKLGLSAPGANNTMVEENTLKLLKETGRTIQVATGTGTNPEIDNRLCDSEHYQIRWYVMKEQSDTWHVDGVLVAKTAEIAITKTFSGLDSEKVAEILGEKDAEDKTSDFQIDTQLGGYGDERQEYLTITNKEVKGQFEYHGTESTANLPNSYHWTLHAITDEKYTMTEKEYAADGYDVSTIIVHYYTDDKLGSQTKYVMADSSAEFYEEGIADIIGGKTTAVSFNNFYTPAGTGALTIIKQDSTTSAGSLYGRLAEAEFTLYTDQACTKTAKDSDGNDLIAISNGNGAAYFSGINPGTYYLKETEAPKGYTASSGVWEIVAETDDDGKVKVTLYELDSEGKKLENNPGTVLYDGAEGGVVGSYTVENTANTSTVTVVKTFSGLKLSEVDALLANSKTDDNGSPTGYYIELQGSIGGDGTVDAEGETTATLTLDQAQRSQDGMTFIWSVKNLLVTRGEGDNVSPVPYVLSENDYMLETYADTVVKAILNGESKPVEIDRDLERAYVTNVTFQPDSADYIMLSNYYTNTFTLTLQKKDSVTDEPLKGAVFDLYGPYREATDTSRQITYTVNKGTADERKETAYYIQTIKAGDDGIARLEGLTLSNTDSNVFVYVINEAFSPNGYVKLDEPIVQYVTVDSTGYAEGVYTADVANTKEQDAKLTLTAKKVWEPYEPADTTVTLDLYRVEHAERGTELGEVEQAALVGSIELNGAADAAPGDAADDSGAVQGYESEPWTATWINVPTADENYGTGEGESSVHYHYFVRERTTVGGYTTSYRCYDRTGNEVKESGAVQTLSIQEEGKEPQNVAAYLLADMAETYTVEITNKLEYRLPESGGTGTQLFTLGGALFMTGSLLYGYRLRRKRERRGRK